MSAECNTDRIAVWWGGKCIINASVPQRGPIKLLVIHFCSLLLYMLCIIAVGAFFLSLLKGPRIYTGHTYTCRLLLFAAFLKQPKVYENKLLYSKNNGMSSCICMSSNRCDETCESWMKHLRAEWNMWELKLNIDIIQRSPCGPSKKVRYTGRTLIFRVN